jgi:hypothetical protein
MQGEKNHICKIRFNPLSLTTKRTTPSMESLHTRKKHKNRKATKAPGGTIDGYASPGASRYQWRYPDGFNPYHSSRQPEAAPMAGRWPDEVVKAERQEQALS